MMFAHHEDTLVMVVKNISVEMHHHHAIQLVISLDEPYRAILDHQAFESVRGFLADANVPHACQAKNSTVLVISVDATSEKGKRLKQTLMHRQVMLIDEIFSIEQIDHFTTNYWSYRSNVNLEFDPLYFIHKLSDGKRDVTLLDARVLAAIEFINQNIGRSIQTTDISHHVGLSASRLRHLFSDQIGISITSYILWSRIKVALREMLKPDVTLSDAAHQANFSDHAHFSRTFKRMFGASPSLLLQHSEFIEVFGLS